MASEQAAFSQKLKDAVETLLDSYVRILQAAKLGARGHGRDSVETERLQLTAHAAGVVGEAQALFKLITELKLSLLTSNLEGLNAVVDERNAAFATSRDAAIANVKTLEADIDSCLDRLETHYYSSVYR